MYISESIKDDSKHLNCLGYDEFKVLDDIIWIAAKTNFKITIKLHPQENKAKYRSYKINNDIKVSKIKLEDMIYNYTLDWNGFNVINRISTLRKYLKS